jgi:glycosyltransferase involved in cell wall biosynthesis
MESYYPVLAGPEVLMRGIVSVLVSAGVSVTIVTVRTDPALARFEIVDGAAVHRVGHRRGRWRAIPSIWRALHRLADDFDVILVQCFRALGMPAVAAGRWLRKPVVLCAQNNGEMSGEYFDPALSRLGLSHRSFGLRTMNRGRQALLRRADHFVAIADSIRRELICEGVTPERITLIPNGVPTARFHPAAPGEKMALRHRLALPESAPVVCFTGRFVRWKGPLDLLAAWSEVAGAPDRLLLFLGAGGPDLWNCEAEGRAFVAKRGLGGSVRFLGDVENVEEYLRAADVFALPTHNDSFAIALLEAMATGLPSVTTQVAGLADYVRPEGNALCVASGDVRELTHALDRLLSSAELRDRLGREAQATAARYSIEAVAEQYLALAAALSARR